MYKILNCSLCSISMTLIVYKYWFSNHFQGKKNYERARLLCVIPSLVYNIWPLYFLIHFFIWLTCSNATWHKELDSYRFLKLCTRLKSLKETSEIFTLRIRKNVPMYGIFFISSDIVHNIECNWWSRMMIDENNGIQKYTAIKVSFKIDGD